MRKLRPGRRKTSIIRTTSASGALADGRQLVDRRGPAHAARVGEGVGQRLEDPLGDLRAAGAARLVERLLRVLRQRIVNRADRFVVLDVDRRRRLAECLPVIPRPHQRVLHERQLIVVVAEVVEDAVDQPRRDRGARHADRARNRRAQRVARHAADEIQPAVHRFRQAGEIHAVADEIGAHRQDDVDRRVALARGFEQQAHERDRLVARVGNLVAAAEPEQLFELIDEHEDVLVRRDVRLTDRVDQAERAAAQRRFEQHAARARDLGVLALDTQHAAFGHGGREVADRIFAGAEGRHAPARAGAHHEAALQRGDQARADERRLAAAGRADDRQEPRRAQAPEQLVGFLLATEKQVVFVRLERTQTGKWIKQGRLPSRRG